MNSEIPKNEIWRRGGKAAQRLIVKGETSGGKFPKAFKTNTIVTTHKRGSERGYLLAHCFI